MNIVYYLTFTGYCGKSLENIIKIFNKNYTCSGLIHLPTKKQKFVVLKSPHVFKKSREHFEKVIFKKSILVNVESTNDVLFNKIVKGISWSMFGVSFKKTKLTKNCFYI